MAEGRECVRAGDKVEESDADCRCGCVGASNAMMALSPRCWLERDGSFKQSIRTFEGLFRFQLHLGLNRA